ncbi:hypothetical protein GALL_123630 [mine drainage metagenome]|uniref:SbsA Ig-like domain-containing protein n=1 Tax=mine drainage metagenome TaxID=410659 RepID=A0A1J5SCD5_9ZZZZ
MKRIDSITKPLVGFVALLLTVLAAGCGGGSSPILGGGGAGLPGTLVDKTRPTVTLTVPANAGSLAANSAITATFSKDMAPATVTAPATFTVKETVSGTNVPGATVTYSVGGKTATFKPTAALTPTLGYTATITTAATDLAGNALAGNQAPLPAASDYVWSFTAIAADVTAPTITLTSPANLATAVPLNSAVNATFSKAMDQATLSTTTFTLATSAVPAVSVLGAVTYDSVNNIAIFTPSSNLVASTTYTATVTNGAKDLAGNALVVPAAASPANPWTFTTGTGLAPGAVALGSASTFGIMATAAVTAASASIINGDVSLDPGTSMTGFPPAIVNGSIHINDTVSAQARADLLSSYNNAKGLACATTVGSADLGGLYVYPTGIPPGVYCSGSTMLVGTHIVLDAGGNANAVWVFQVGSSLTTGADVTLMNGAQAKNVFWVPTLDATIGSGTIFNGTIVSGRDATSAGSATIYGRILAGAIYAGTIALNGPPSTVNVPAP